STAWPRSCPADGGGRVDAPPHPPTVGSLDGELPRRGTAKERQTVTAATAADNGFGAAPARKRAGVSSGPSRSRRVRGSAPRPDNHVIVLFGATGDLARRKLPPGLFPLAAAR